MKNYLKIFVFGTMLHGVQTYGITVYFRTSVQDASYETYEVKDFNLEQTVEDLKNHIVKAYAAAKGISYSLTNYQCILDSFSPPRYKILKHDKTLSDQRVIYNSELFINSLENDKDQLCCYNIIAKHIIGNPKKIEGLVLNSKVGDLKAEIAEKFSKEEKNVRLVYLNQNLEDDDVFLSDIFALWQGVKEEFTVQVVFKLVNYNADEHNEGENSLGGKTDKKKWWGWCPC